MKINNLNHIESTVQSVVGAWGSYYPYYCFVCPEATATAGAGALAVGIKTVSGTYTNVQAIAGVFSQSASMSYANAR